MKNLQTSNNMIKGNHRIRLNGYVKSDVSNAFRIDAIGSSNFHDAIDEHFNHHTKLFIKDEPDDEYDTNTKIAMHSIIDVNNEECKAAIKLHMKKNKIRSTHHEILQRIECLNDDQYNHYQKHWFSAGLERLKVEDRSREERLEITRYELKRHLKQLVRCNVGETSRLPPVLDWSDALHRLRDKSTNSSSSLQAATNNDRLVLGRYCDVVDCKRMALPCARHCTLHIMENQDQVLFNYCTAKFADNTQCSVPVFDILHELPLCVEHARKRDNYKMYQEAKPKKLRKKVKPSAMIRPQKRNKKKKKLLHTTTIDAHHTVECGGQVEVPCNIIETSEITDEIMTDVADDEVTLGEDMVEQVLALQEPDALELANVEQVLVTQASNLLEETDITTVLNNIQADEFNDFFTVNRNGEYEPTREETEELERALAAVDNDVKTSLEKLSQSHGLLDTFLDDHTLVESLVQSSIVPDVFHNGFNTCGENIMVGQTSRLLSVQPHSHS